jgi:hypothetical protein
MTTDPHHTPASRAGENVEVVATQTQDGAFEIQVTRNPTTGSLPPAPVNAGAANLGSTAGHTSVAASPSAGAWKGIVAAAVVAIGLAGVGFALVSSPPPPPVEEVVAAPDEEPAPESTREQRRFTVYQGGVYQPQQPLPRAATVNFGSIQYEPDTTDGEASGRIDEQTELVMPDEPALEGEIPLIPSNEDLNEAPQDQLPEEVVEQLREVPVEE